jgi:type II secretory pathway component PulJ
MKTKDKIITAERSEGLTLIELLVALAVFGLIITGIIFYLMRTAQTTGRRVDVAVTVQQSARLAMDQLTRELRQTGYHRQSAVPFSIGAASEQVACTATSIEFEAELQEGSTNQLTRVAYQYLTATKVLQRRVSTGTAGTNNFTCGGIALAQTSFLWNNPWETIVDNVSNFTVTYNMVNKEGNTKQTTTPDCNDLQYVDTIQIALESQVNNPYPGAGAPVSIKLLSEVRTRNTGIFGGCSQNPPPLLAPSGLGVTDLCLCTRLQFSWGASGSASVTGYRVMVGTQSGMYQATVDVGKNILTYTLDQSMGLQPGVAYFVAVAALDDNCHNISAAAEFAATGSAVPGACGPSDSAPSPLTPEAVDVTQVQTVSAPGSVKLTWPAVVHGGAPRDDLNGYRVYRSQTGAAGSFACINCNPINNDSVTVNLTPGASTYTYTDNDPTLVGCTVYYYRIAAVNCMGEGSQTASIHGDGDKTNDPADYPLVGVTNTTPQDNTPPADPTSFIASPGSKEVVLTFKTPADADATGVLILWSAASTPPEAVNGQKPTGNVAYDQAGLAPNNTYDTHHSGLTNGTHYYYRAYAYDRCGNYSKGATSASDAQPCNDVDIPPPGTQLWYHGAPPAPTITAVKYCGISATIYWQAPKMLNTGTGQMEVPPDLYVYRIYRDGTQIKEVGATEEATDSTLDEATYAGKEVKYQVQAIDCANNASPLSASVSAFPGSINVDQTRAALFTTAGDNHNQVYFVIHNSSAAIATVQSMVLDYNQSSAYVKQVDFYTADGDSPYLTYTFEKTVYQATGAPTLASGGIIHFTGNPQISGAGAFPGASYRVVKVTFTGADGVDTSAADMRGITISSAKFTFFLASGDPCDMTSTQFTLPTGPLFSGTSQQPPSASAFLASTTLTGAYTVLGGNETNVMSFINTDSSTSTITATLYYQVTNKTTSSVSRGNYPFTGWTSLSMLYDSTGKFFILSQSGSGTKIPAEDGNRVWYFIYAHDDKGQINTDPASSSLAYTYDESIVDPCTTIPNAPTSLSAAACGTDEVLLSWAPVTKNTDNTNITDLKGYKLYRYNDPGYTTLSSGFPKDVGENINYTDSGSNLATTNHWYKVTAYDTCSPAKVSSLSTGIMSPITGVSGSKSLTTSIGSVNPWISGVTTDTTGRFTVTLIDPAFACGGSKDTGSEQIVWIHDCASSGLDDDWFRLKEVENTGVFYIDKDYYGGRDFIQATYGGNQGPWSPWQRNLDLQVSKSDTITLTWNQDTAAGSEGTACTVGAGGISATVTVIPDPCLDTPNAPVLNTASKGTGNSRMDFTWTAPSQNTDNSTIIDLAGFYVYRGTSSSGPWTNVGLLATSNCVGTSCSINNFDIGVNLNLGDYYFSLTTVDTCSPPNESVKSNVKGPF